jgi:hypothetical protein
MKRPKKWRGLRSKKGRVSPMIEQNENTYYPSFVITIGTVRLWVGEGAEHGVGLATTLIAHHQLHSHCKACIIKHHLRQAQFYNNAKEKSGAPKAQSPSFSQVENG